MLVQAPEDWTEVAGIFVKGCVARGEGSRFRHMAHAHNTPKDGWFGWICVLSPKRLGVVTPLSHATLDAAIEKPSGTLWHEYAHIKTPGHGHDDKWRAMMRALKQPLPARYQKKARAKWTVLFRCAAHPQYERWQLQGTLAARCPLCHEWMVKEYDGGPRP